MRQGFGDGIRLEEVVMKRCLALFALTAVVGAGCTPPGPDLDVAFADLAAADAAYLEALSSLDAEAFASFYDTNAQMYPPNHAALVGPVAILDYAEEVFATPGLSITVTSTPVHMGVGGELGYSMATAEVSMPGPDGTVITERGPDVHVWRKQAAGPWRIVVDIWNSDVPLPVPGEGGD
jgi:ketosteroid isomerase-like protein